MKLPKGFGKNYFTLNAITATVAQISLNATAVRVQSFHTLSYKSEELEAEEEIEELAILCPLQLFVKPCHCNCYFFKKTRKTLKLYFTQKLFFNYFKTLNNSISPPSFLSLQDTSDIATCTSVIAKHFRHSGLDPESQKCA